MLDITYNIHTHTHTYMSIDIQFPMKLLLQIDQGFTLNYIPTRTAINLNLPVNALVKHTSSGAYA